MQADPPPAQPPGELPRIGRYVLEQRIGEGGAGAVYRAWDPLWDRFVALKVMRNQGPIAVEELKHEFRAAARVRHRNVASCYELDVEGASDLTTRACVTMELVDGTNLQRWLHPGTEPMDLSRVRLAFEQLVAGVLAIHDAGLLHLDLKPANVLVDSADRLAIVDFGAAAHRVTAREPWIEGWVTPAYAAPEQFLSEALGPGADWFSVGLMLFEILTGHRAERAHEDRSGALIAGCLDTITDGSWRDACAGLLADHADERSPERLCSLLGRSYIRSEWPRRVGAADRHDVPLAYLREGARQAIGGSQRRVWLVGPPERAATLVSAFAAEIRAQGWRVLSAHPYGRERVPFNLFDGIAEELAGELWSAPDLVPEGGLGALAQAFPAIGLALLDAVRPTRRLTEDLVALLSRMATRRPLCLVFGDISWGDRDSARLFLELVLGLQSQRVLIVLGHVAGAPGAFEEELRAFGWWDAAQARDSIVPLGPAPTNAAEAIAALSPAARRALSSLVLLGGPSRIIWLRELAGVDAAACDELDVASLVHMRLRGACDALIACATPAVEVAASAIPADGGLAERAAIALAADPAVPSERIARLWDRAGNRDAARDAGEKAAREAFAAGAFDRAGTLWEWVSSLTADRAHRDTARAAAADCHVLAGHRAHAAKLVEAMAAETANPDALHLRAADLWFGSGHPDRGRALLAARLPHVAAGSALGVARGVVRTLAAGRDGHLADAAWTATRGLLSTDWLAGCASALVGLAVTPRLDAPRWARARIVAGGVVIGPMPGPIGRYGRKLLEAGGAVGERSGDPYLRGIARVIRGQMNLLDGQWNAARNDCLEGLTLLEPLGTEVEYERNIGRMGWMRATEELGDFTRLPEAAPDAFQRALRSNDRYAALTLAFNASLGWLARGEAVAAETILAMASADWSEPSITLQDVYLVRTRALIALWSSDAGRARMLWEDLWPRLRRSAILAVPLGTVDVWAGRGRAALAILDRGPDRAALAVASEAARRLLRVRRPDAQGIGALFSAALARDKAASRLAIDQATAAFKAGSMAGLETCAQLRRAELDGSRVRVDEHHASMRALGIADPIRWAAAHAPGFAAHT